MNTPYEYNQRQLRLMLEALASYERGKSSLHALANSLEGLVNVLEEPRPSWKRDFLKYWGLFDDINAIAIDRNTNKLSENDIMDIHNAIEQLKHLISSEMGG